MESSLVKKSLIMILYCFATNKALSKKSNFIVYLSLIILAVFAAWFFTDNWFTKLFNIFLGKNLVTFFLLFCLILKINEKTKTFDFAKKDEHIKIQKKGVTLNPSNIDTII